MAQYSIQPRTAILYQRSSAILHNNTVRMKTVGPQPPLVWPYWMPRPLKIRPEPEDRPQMNELKNGEKSIECAACNAPLVYIHDGYTLFSESHAFCAWQMGQLSAASSLALLCLLGSHFIYYQHSLIWSKKPLTNPPFFLTTQFNFLILFSQAVLPDCFISGFFFSRVPSLSGECTGAPEVAIQLSNKPLRRDYSSCYESIELNFYPAYHLLWTINGC